MKIIVLDSLGNCVGDVRDYAVFGLDGEKVCEAKPETTFKEIIQALKWLT